MVTEMGPNMPEVNVAVIVGSNRRDSINRRLAQARLAEGKTNARPFEQLLGRLPCPYDR
jgi:NAD(P)H-dependent FMN reductase